MLQKNQFNNVAFPPNTTQPFSVRCNVSAPTLEASRRLQAALAAALLSAIAACTTQPTETQATRHSANAQPLSATKKTSAKAQAPVARTSADLPLPSSKVVGERLTTAIGVKGLQIVAQAEGAWAARLRLISANEAQTPEALKDAKRITGYPIEGGLVPIPAEQRAALATAIGNSGNYTRGLRQRCRDREKLGLRFERGDESVEFSLGRPCGLATWTFFRDNIPVLWGEVMTESASSTLFAQRDTLLR